MVNGQLIIVIFLTILVTYIIFQRYAPKEPSPTVQLIKERLMYIDPKLADIPMYIDDSAYTIDKRTIYICLKDRETGEIFDINTLMYVTLHELAHVATREREYDSMGNVDEHGPIFRKNFAKLLKIAAQQRIYDPSKPLPQSYCGAKRS